MTSFDAPRYYEEVDAERRRRGLTWAGLARELNAPFAHRPDIPPISPSTISRVRERASLNGNIVVHTLMWLRRAPEEFIMGHPVNAAPLPELTAGFLPRWDTAALFAAIEAKRRLDGLGWADVARQVGLPPEVVRAFRKSAGFPGVMRVLAWLDRAAADFVVNVPV